MKSQGNGLSRIGYWLLLTSLMLLNACGGGGGSEGNALNSAVQTPNYTPGVFNSSTSYAAQCAAPRSDTTDKRGSTAIENFWLRSWSHELYLWYRELPDLNPGSYNSTATYFDLMKTTATTNTGKKKDQFHFTYGTAEWQALSQSGVSAGYGAEWVVAVSGPPYDIRVAFIEPGSPAAAANLSRGVRIISIDGADAINPASQSAVDTLNAGLSPTAVNQTHTFVVRELNGTQRSVSLTSTKVTSTPVQNVTTLPGGNGTVGYMLFNDHIATAEQQLITAFNTLKQANVSDLVLDIRYNGGGYLAIASEVAYMIAGSAATSNRTFERLRFNDQYNVASNPVTGGSNTPTPFYSSAQFTSSTALPTLNLPRVFVITGNGTCSASESIINGLRGIGVQVIQIGSTTCGKPYGFYPQDNCGTTYFSIEFQGVNESNFGDYPDGFSPLNTPSNAGVTLPGCSVADDFSHALGSTSESRLAAALSYRNNGSCPTPSGTAGQSQIQAIATDATTELILSKQPWRENRILSR